MSKVGKKVIIIPEGVKVSIENGSLKFVGNNGTLETPVLDNVTPKIEGAELTFSIKDDGEKQTLANWGTTRALANNAILGVQKDFTKDLKIEGVGYKASVDGKTLVLTVGFSHLVKLEIPEGLKAVVEKNVVKISGSDKEAVGQFAAKIKAVRKPEPYKGTGIMYVGEVIRRKAGKKVAGSGK